MVQMSLYAYMVCYKIRTFFRLDDLRVLKKIYVGI